jgi:hypothetical protein
LRWLESELKLCMMGGYVIYTIILSVLFSSKNHNQFVVFTWLWDMAFHCVMVFVFGNGKRIGSTGSSHLSNKHHVRSRNRTCTSVKDGG